jgi:ABC-2 type transport system ATP-binding protein
VHSLEKVSAGRSLLSIDTLEVKPGEILAVIGPAKSGKTLLIRMLAGNVPLSGGTIVLSGDCADQAAGSGRQTGVLFQEDLLYERQSVQENLAFYCRLLGLPTRRAAEVLVEVGLSDQASQTPAKLSAAACRRLAFARILLWPHCLLLLDQPILRADLDTQALFARLIRQRAAEGAMIVLTDEDMSWASQCCTRVLEIDDGRVTQSYWPDRAARPEAAAPERKTLFKIPAHKEDRVVLYDPGDILYAASRDGKTYLRTVTEEAVTNFTLQELEGRLLGWGFFKSHRAYLVNLKHVLSVIQYTRNTYNLQLDDERKTVIPLSRQFEKELKDLLGY